MAKNKFEYSKPFLLIYKVFLLLKSNEIYFFNDEPKTTVLVALPLNLWHNVVKWVATCLPATTTIVHIQQ